jgi:RNA polymerase sigma-70 factor (ECF subfamily)
MDGDRFKTDIIPLRSAMLAMAVKMLGDADDAEDAVQEAMLRVWELRDRMAHISNPKAYVMQTLKNFCLDRLRAEKETVDATEISISDDETPYHAAERRDAVALVRQIVASLPRLQRMIIEMRDIEGYEPDEIAAATGTRLSAVTVNLSRARKAVRDRFMLINNYKTI